MSKIEDVRGDRPPGPLINVFGDDSEEDGCWGDCMEEDMSENNLYKEDEKDSESHNKIFALAR